MANAARACQPVSCADANRCAEEPLRIRLQQHTKTIESEMDSRTAKRHKSFDNNCPTTRENTLATICNWSEPRGIAVRHCELDKTIQEITYAQLAEVQQNVEQVLRATKSTQFIGITADTPSHCLPGLMLGIMSSNHAFVCLPSSPAATQSISKALNISHIFGSRNIDELKVIQEFKFHGAKIFLAQSAELCADSTSSAVPDESCGEFAYAITTSGSTGQPKIVRVTHSSIVPNIVDLKRILGASRRDTIAQITSMTFDPSIVEIFLSLSCNGILLTVSQELKDKPEILLKTIVENRVSILQTTPSLLLHRWSSEELRKSILAANSCLRILLLGGEGLPSMEILEKTRAPDNETRIFDIYGITEVSCWASIREIDWRDSTRTLGESLSETILEVRDEAGNIVEEGEGILHIGSASRICVINDEDVNCLSCPTFRDTGDIVAIDRTGRLTLKGRRGRRVKRFGTKLYLSDLENHVSKLPFVENCYALFNERNQSLHLYFTILDKCIDNDDERLRCETDVLSHTMQLSSIHRPDRVCLLSRFELTSHGKICSNSLKKHSARLSRISQAGNGIGKNAVETFTNLWENSLPFSGDSGFIDAGGSSVIALRIASELSDQVGNDFPELIGQLLMNKNLHACREYVGKKLFSERNSIAVIAENNKSENLSCENSEANIDDQSTRLDEENPIYRSSNGIIPWQKCRGKNDFPLSLDVQKKNVWNSVAKIRLEHLYSLEKCVDASPTVFRYPGSGKSYVTVGSHAGIICTAELCRKDAPEHWKLRLPDRIEASVLVLEDFRGVVGCYDGHLYCLHLKTGEIFWKFKTDDTVKCTAVLCSRGRSVFFGSYDRHAYCVSLETGSEVWKLKPGNGSICATPCVDAELDSVFFALLDGTCVSLKQNSGEANWRQKLDYPVFSAPAILKIGVAVFCDVAGQLTGFCASSGEKLWTLETNGAIFSHLVIHTERTTKLQSLVFASKDRCVYILECRSKDEKPIVRMKNDCGVPIISTPWCSGKAIALVGVDGDLKILDFTSGKELSSFKLGGDVFSSPIIHENFIVVGCRDDNLYVLSATSD